MDENHGMTVTIYETDGIHPAERARVKIYEAGSIDLQPVSLYLTDDDGRFSIGDLPGGIYRFWIEKDSTALFQDSVLVTSSHSTLRDDTLECASTLSGIVGMPPLHDPRTVTIRLLGTGKTVTVSESDGRFTLTGLAGGAYSLYLASELPGYIPALREVIVASCSDDTMHDTLQLFTTDIPAVSGIRLRQDTISEKIILSWDKSAYTNLLDYVIYRENCTEVNLVKTAYHSIPDTFFVDDLRSLFITDTRDSAIDTAVQCLKYWVALRSNEREIGPAYRYAGIQAASKAYVTTFLTHGAVHTNGTHNRASINDTMIFSLHAGNATRTLKRLVWFDPLTKDTVGEAEFDDTSEKEIIDSLRYSFPDTGAYELHAIVIDDAQTEWRDTIAVTIVMDIPEADAGNDTGVFIGEKVVLHGSAQQRFGEITGWQWKIGSAGDWTETSGPDTIITVQSPEPAMVCSLAVTDEDGNRSVDDVQIICSERIRTIVAGGNHSLIQAIDSSVWCFGFNKYGQLGDGTSDDQYFPIRMTTDVSSMAAGSRHSLILRNDGALLGCGYNRNGQLGDGSDESCTFLIQITLNVQRIAAGSFHSLILKTDGTLWTCGRNEYGQLGDSTLENHTVPVRVMDEVQDMAAGLFHTLILKKDGSLLTCGCDSLGQLGDSTDKNRTWPLQIMTDVKCMAAGENHNLILKKDGTLWACGDNYYGQLGDGTNVNRTVPVKIMDEVKNIATGASHSLILKNDGSLLTCGHNRYGQLGNGTTDFRSTPKEIITDVQSVAAGALHTLILKTDGSVWACGSNRNGELGSYYLGFGADRIESMPQQVVPFKIPADEEPLP